MGRWEGPARRQLHPTSIYTQHRRLTQRLEVLHKGGDDDVQDAVVAQVGDEGRGVHGRGRLGHPSVDERRRNTRASEPWRRGLRAPRDRETHLRFSPRSQRLSVAPWVCGSWSGSESGLARVNSLPGTSTSASESTGRDKTSRHADGCERRASAATTAAMHARTVQSEPQIRCAPRGDAMVGPGHAMAARAPRHRGSAWRDPPAPRRGERRRRMRSDAK